MNPIESVNTSKIVQLKVGRNEFSPHTWDPLFSFDVITTTDEVIAKEKKIRRVIQKLNEDIVWPDAPTYEDVIEMVSFGSQCWILMYEDLACGWFWGNNNVITKDFKSDGYKLEPHECYLGTGTVSRKDKKVVNASQIAFRQAVELYVSYNKKDVAYLYCDDWNIWSIKLCKGLGMYEYDFINDR